MTSTSTYTETAAHLSAAFAALRTDAAETMTVRARRTAVNAYTGPGARYGTYTEPTAAASRAIAQRRDICDAMARITFGA